MERLSVNEAARVLGVSRRRVQARINDGSLPAVKVGSQWVIDPADLLSVQHRVRSGRPLSERSAWALIAAAADDQQFLSMFEPPERSRARARLRALSRNVQAVDIDEAAALLVSALGNRSERIVLSASPRDLDDVRADARIRLSGLSAPESHISSGGLVEGYVSSADVAGFIEHYLLSPASQQQANVILHAVSAELSELMSAAVLASPLLLAADLAEHLGSRERNEAVQAVARIPIESHRPQRQTRNTV